MADKDELVRSYAEALFRVADAEGELDAVERQLFAFAKLLERETRCETRSRIRPCRRRTSAG